jgi:hypothetical protein
MGLQLLKLGWLLRSDLHPVLHAPFLGEAGLEAKQERIRFLFE